MTSEAKKQAAREYARLYYLNLSQEDRYDKIEKAKKRQAGMTQAQRDRHNETCRKYKAKKKPSF